MDRIWSDVEVTEASKDRLDRMPFSHRAAELITSVPIGAESTVFGIIGPWGSGKSSILNLIEAKLPNDQVHAVRFSPWAVTEESGLLAEFFNTLLSASPVLRKKKNQSQVVALAKKGLPALGAIPGAGTALRDTVGSLLAPENWNTQFRKVQEILEAEKVRILLIVDDVDRLHGDEVLTLIKTIRMLGRFNNVHYLLAYDHAALCDALLPKVGSRERAAAYLEKIVQYPLVIPAAQKRHLKLLLEEGLAELPKATLADRNSGALLRFDWFYTETASHIMTTVRSIKRFISQASHYLSLAGVDEVDVGDFLALTFLRLHFPAIYELLPMWKEDLTGQRSSLEPNYRAPSQEEWHKRFLAAQGSEKSAYWAEQTMKELFPGLYSGHHSNEVPRISHPDYFDRFFVFGVPEGDVSDINVNNDVERVLKADIENFSVNAFRSTFTSTHSGVANASVEKATSITRSLSADPTAAERLLSFLLWLASISPEITYSAAFSIWFGDLLARHPGFDELQLQDRLAAIPEVRHLRSGLNRASTLLEHVYDPESLAVTHGAALAQFKSAISEVAIDQLLISAKSAPRDMDTRRFYDTYAVIRDCGELPKARKRFSEAIRREDLNLVSLVSLLMYRSGDPASSSKSLDVNALVTLVDQDVLMEHPLTVPSVGQLQGKVSTLLDDATSLLAAWRDSEPFAPSP